MSGLQVHNSSSESGDLQLTSVDQDYAAFASEQLGLTCGVLVGVEGSCAYRCAVAASGLPTLREEHSWQAMMVAAHIQWASDARYSLSVETASEDAACAWLQSHKTWGEFFSENTEFRTYSILATQAKTCANHSMSLLNNARARVRSYCAKQMCSSAQARLQIQVVGAIRGSLADDIQ